MCIKSLLTFFIIIFFVFCTYSFFVFQKSKNQNQNQKQNIESYIKNTTGTSELEPIQFSSVQDKMNSQESLNQTMYCYNFPTDKKCRQKEEIVFDTETIDGAENFPSIDGSKTKDVKKRALFMFAKNKCDPKCCPSQYTCGKGCICLTKKQKCWLHKHGVAR